MGKRQSLEEKFLARPPEVTFNEVKTLMRQYGAELVRTKGSHHIFRRADGAKQTVPTKHGRKVARDYVDQIIEFLGLGDDQ